MMYACRQSPCPPSQWTVALHVDRILESSSRPPSSRAFWLDTVKSTRVVARPTSLCHQPYVRFPVEISGLTDLLLLYDLRSGLGDAAFYEISLNFEFLLRAQVHHGIEGQVAG